MRASWNGHLEVVRTLLESGADINAKDNVRNQMMMINYDDDDYYNNDDALIT